MIQELAWYIESGRFTGIVEELEEKAASYAASLAAGSEDADERGEEFRALCRWHMKKSDFRADEAETMDIEAEFLDGAELKREALDRFEKEVIKAHMYQKHLWEFMGTTGSMTVISKSAMSRDGFSYSAYLPIEHRRRTPQKSPLSGALKEHPPAVPVYQYLDGSVSTEYDSGRAAARFNVLKDRSGFDWSSEGWDPNYEVEKNGWHGEYSPDGIWTLVRENEQTAQGPLRSAAEFSPPLELIRDGGGAILYDPGRSLLSPALRVWLLEDGSVYGAEKTDIRKTEELIRSALGRMGMENITAICAGDGKKRGGARMINAYRAALGELVSPDAKPKTAAEAEESRRKFHAGIQAEETARAGRQLFRAVEAAVRSGAKDADAAQAVRSGTVQIPLSLYDESDRAALGLTEADGGQILSYGVPEEERAAFSATVLGLLKEERLLATGGISRSDIISMAYAYAVQGKKPEGTVSVETTLARLCSDPGINLRCEETEEATLARLEEAYKSIPRQADAETQRAADAAAASAMRSFAAIRMSTGMTPEEAVEAAVRTAGGRTGKYSPVPHGRIEYVTPGTGGADDGKRRIFSDIPLGQLVEECAAQPPRTKEADIQAVMAHSENDGDGTAYNLLSAEERRAWYESEAFKESGLSVEEAETLAAEEAERLAQERKPEQAAVISWETELDERHGLARQQDMGRAASVRIVPPMARVSAEEAAEQLNRRLARKSAAKKGDGRMYNLLSEEGRAQFYRTAEFKEIGLTEEEADGLITAYAGRAGTSAVRVLLIDALLFGKAVRRAKRDRRNVPPEETMAAATAQEASGLTYSLLPEEEWKGLHRTEASRSAGISAEEAEQASLEHTSPPPGGAGWSGDPAIDAASSARTAAEAREAGGLTAAQVMRKALALAVIGESEEAKEPFRAWNPSSGGAPAPKPVAAVRAADAAQARRLLLAGTAAGRAGEQEKNAHNSFSQTQRHPDTAGNPFTANDAVPEQAERRNARKSFQGGRQDAGTGGNPFPGTDGASEQTEIPSWRMTERQNDREFPRSSRQDAGVNRDSFSESNGTPEHTEIAPRQPAERKNAEELLSQDRQVAGMRGNSPAAEKRTGAQTGGHDTITVAQHSHDERAGQDAEARRMERLNAAYEHDRAALAKEDPAFARGTFRDIGHAEGSGEADGHDIRKIIAMKKSGLMTDMEKDTEKGL